MFICCFRFLSTSDDSQIFFWLFRLALDLSAPLSVMCLTSPLRSLKIAENTFNFAFPSRQLLSFVASGREEKTWKSKMLSLFGLFSLINSLSKVNFYCFSFSFVCDLRLWRAAYLQCLPSDCLHFHIQRSTFWSRKGSLVAKTTCLLWVDGWRRGKWLLAHE